MPAGALTKLNPSVCTGFRRAVGFCNSRTFRAGQGSLLGRNCGSSEFLPDSIRLSYVKRQFSVGSWSGRSSMAASGSKALLGEVHVDDLVTGCGGNGDVFPKPESVYFSDRSRRSCRRASMSLRKKESLNMGINCGFFIFDSVRKNCDVNVLIGPILRNVHTSSSVCFSAGAAPFDGTSQDEQVGDSTSASDQYVVSRPSSFWYQYFFRLS